LSRSGVLAHDDTFAPHGAERLRALMGSIRSGVLLEDYSRRIELVNPAFCTIFRLISGPDQLAGSDHLRLANRTKELFTDPEVFLKTIQRGPGREAEITDLLPMRDGRILERTRSPVRQNQVVDGYTWVYRDVTESTLLALGERESEERIRAMVESAPYAVIAIDGIGRIREFNPEATKLFGWESQEVTGLPFCEVLLPTHLHPTYHDGIERLLESGRSDLLGKGFTTSALHRNGQPVRVDVVLSQAKVGSSHDLFTAYICPSETRRPGWRGRWRGSPTAHP
jgi:PAS domain S-box-containing protein